MSQVRKGRYGTICVAVNKYRYSSMESAERMMAKLITGPTLHAPRRAYRCEHCGGWHLTSQQPRRHTS